MKRFINDESGAVTVDWVVLTAAIVGIAIAVLTVIAGGINEAAVDINTDLTADSSGPALAIDGVSDGGS